MIHKHLVVVLLLLSVWFFRVEVAFAQELNLKDNQALFGQLQEELAGESTTWEVRDVDEEHDNTFVPKPITPQQLLNSEENMRTTNDPDDVDTFDVSPTDEEAINQLEMTKEFFDADSWTGAFYRTLVAVGSSKHENYFTGDYIVPTTQKTELGKIKSIYDHIIKTVTRYGPPTGGESASYCLTGGVGECRHMAIILQESLEEVDVKSSLVISPNHVWVRVTLSDPEYAGITFDLDPTWYQQPIPLPPRERTPMSDEWRQRMLAITTGASGAVDLSGRWTTGENEFEGRHVGNSFMLIALTASVPRAIGKPTLIGNLSGTAITGQKFLMAPDCPNIDRYVPATGTVVADGSSLSVSFKSVQYYLETCREKPGSQFDDSSNYTKLEATPSAGRRK